MKNIIYCSSVQKELFTSNTRSLFQNYIDIDNLDHLPKGEIEAGSSGSGVCEKVEKHKQVECKICLKTMTSNTLKRHMKTHEKKTKWNR